MIVITGFHRSGTSMTANLIETAGYTMPNDMPPTSLNAKGYFEGIGIMCENDRLMGRWDQPQLIDDTADMSLLDGFTAVKDPRFCVTLPAWDFDKVIKVYRDKRNACKSLSKASFLDYEECLKLYDLYMEKLGKNTEGMDCISVYYESLLEGDVKELENFIGNVDVSIIDKGLNHGV